MIINFKTCRINWNICNSIWIFTLIKKRKRKERQDCRFQDTNNNYATNPCPSNNDGVIFKHHKTICYLHHQESDFLYFCTSLCTNQKESSSLIYKGSVECLYKYFRKKKPWKKWELDHKYSPASRTFKLNRTKKKIETKLSFQLLTLQV
jgi:hypothetical protein